MSVFSIKPGTLVSQELFADQGLSMGNYEMAIYDPCNDQLRVTQYHNGMFCYNPVTLNLINHIIVDDQGTGFLSNTTNIFCPKNSNTYIVNNVFLNAGAGSNVLSVIP